MKKMKVNKRRSHFCEEVVSFDEVSSNVRKLIKGKWLGLTLS